MTVSLGSPPLTSPTGEAAADLDRRAPADSRLVQETKDQIRTLVQEIASLSKADVSPTEFQEGFLSRVVGALAAFGGALWLTDEAGQLQLAYQVNYSRSGLADSKSHRQQHANLLRQTLAAGEPRLVAPHSGAEMGDFDADPELAQAGNPSDYLLVIAPIAFEGAAAGLVEIYQRAGGGPTTQRGYLRFLVQMGDLAGDYLQSRRLRDLRQRQLLASQLEAFALAVHRGLDLRKTCFALANEGRRLIDCDRLSVVLRRGGRFQVACVSGVETIDRRAAEVRRLAELAETIVAAGEPLWTNARETELAPQVERALADYTDLSHAALTVVLPLALEGEEGNPFGALVAERFREATADEGFRQRAEMAARHGGEALANALAHQRIFLMPLWRSLGRVTSAIGGRHWTRTAAIAMVLAAIAAALAIAPVDFELAAPGVLRPALRHEIYAASDGVLVEVMVEHEQFVNEGEPLARLRDADLEVAIASALGSRATLAERVAAIERQLIRQEALAPDEPLRLSAELLERRQQLASADRRLELLKRQEQELLATSPCDGQVVTWQVEEMLRARPVQRGQNLMTIVEPQGEWELELRVPERRMGHIGAAIREGSRPPDVTFVLATHPAQRFHGRIVEIHRTADPSPAAEDGRETGAAGAVRVRVAIDRRQLPELHDGASVAARIECGRCSLGYALFHEAIDAAYAKVLFWF